MKPAALLLYVSLSECGKVLAGRGDSVNTQQCGKVLAGRGDTVNTQQCEKVLAGRGDTVNTQQCAGEQHCYCMFRCLSVGRHWLGGVTL